MQPLLLAVLAASDERTHDEIVTGFNECARIHGEDATLSPRTFRRWLTGDVQTQPRPTQRRVARIYWGFPMDQLLAPAPLEVFGAGGAGPAGSPAPTAPAVQPDRPEPDSPEEADDGSLHPPDSIERRISM